VRAWRPSEVEGKVDSGVGVSEQRGPSHQRARAGCKGRCEDAGGRGRGKREKGVKGVRQMNELRRYCLELICVGDTRLESRLKLWEGKRGKRRKYPRKNKGGG